MNIHADRYGTDKALQIANTPAQTSAGKSAIQLQDNCPRSVIQKKQADTLSWSGSEPIQLAPFPSGMMGRSLLRPNLLRGMMSNARPSGSISTGNMFANVPRFRPQVTQAPVRNFSNMFANIPRFRPQVTGAPRRNFSNASSSDPAPSPDPAHTYWQRRNQGPLNPLRFLSDTYMQIVNRDE